MQSRDLDEILDGFTLKGGGEFDPALGARPTDAKRSQDKDGSPKSRLEGAGSRDVEKAKVSEAISTAQPKIDLQKEADPALDARFESLFTSLIGRQPTERELEDTLYLARTLRIAEGDPLWPILLTYVHYDARMGEHHSTMSRSLERAQSLLAAISNEAASVRSDVCLIPQTVRHKFPLWVQVGLSVKAIWAAMTLMAFAISSITLMVVLDRSTLNPNDPSMEKSCYEGKGVFVKDKTGVLYCFPGKEKP